MFSILKIRAELIKKDVKVENSLQYLKTRDIYQFYEEEYEELQTI